MHDDLNRVAVGRQHDESEQSAIQGLRGYTARAQYDKYHDVRIVEALLPTKHMQLRRGRTLVGAFLHLPTLLCGRQQMEDTVRQDVVGKWPRSVRDQRRLLASLRTACVRAGVDLPLREFGLTQQCDPPVRRSTADSGLQHTGYLCLLLFIV